MKTKLISNKIKVMFASLLTIAAILSIAAAPAYAAGLGPVAKTAISSRYTDAQLSSMLRHDEEWFGSLKGRVNNQAGNLVTLSETMAGEIPEATPNNQTVQNIDITLEEREADLVASAAPLDRGQDLTANIQSVIDGHAGFDTKGDVINKVVAGETVSTLNTLLGNTQYWLTRSNTDLFSKSAR
jgi:hypothetical protein